MRDFDKYIAEMRLKHNCTIPAKADNEPPPRQTTRYKPTQGKLFDVPYNADSLPTYEE